MQKCTVRRKPTCIKTKISTYLKSIKLLPESWSTHVHVVTVEEQAVMVQPEVTWRLALLNVTSAAVRLLSYHVPSHVVGNVQAPSIGDRIRKYIKRHLTAINFSLRNINIVTCSITILISCKLFAFKNALFTSLVLMSFCIYMVIQMVQMRKMC